MVKTSQDEESLPLFASVSSDGAGDERVDVWQSKESSWRPRWATEASAKSSKTCHWLKILALVLLSGLGGFMLDQSLRPGGVALLKRNSPLSVTQKRYTKPDGVRIIGLIFYGRPRFVSILDCYLRRNLVSNGGWLDEVVFFENTDDQRALDWLNATAANEPLYTILRGRGYGSAWNHSVEDKDAIYIKLDDDLVFIADDAIPLIASTLIANPSAYIVLANLINSSILHWYQWHTRAFHPFLPELSQPAPPSTPATSWRTSELPPWSNETSITMFDWTQQPSQVVGDVVNGGPPRSKHRWLPLPWPDNNEHGLWKTPLSSAEHNGFGRALSWWTLPAQQHYSFLKNFEEGQLERYAFGGGLDNVWDSHAEYRCNLNIAAIWGRDVINHPPGNDDEQHMTVDIPRSLKRPVLIQTEALAVHFSFRPVAHVIETTDLLSRYQGIANEFVCPNSDFSEWA